MFRMKLLFIKRIFITGILSGGLFCAVTAFAGVKAQSGCLPHTVVQAETDAAELRKQLAH